MTVEFYLIEMEPGPYSIENKQRPRHLDVIKANWSGYPLFLWDQYLCQVNTKTAKHTQLQALPGVQHFPVYKLETVIKDMEVEDVKELEDLVNLISITHDPAETLEELIHRIICYSEWEIVLGEKDDLLGDTLSNSNSKIHDYGNKWKIPTSDTETLSEVINKHGPVYWDPKKIMAGEF